MVPGAEGAVSAGGADASDVAMCVNHGYHTMKLFPAGDMPMSYIKSLKGPFDDTEYVAIGGVSADNIEEFFRRGYLGAGWAAILCQRNRLRLRTGKPAPPMWRSW